MNVPEQVTRLIETFDRNIEAYKDPEYKETQLRHEFVDPFFMALGWDVNNTAGLAEAYKDVIHEDSIRVGSATKAPDYCFRIGGTRKFFVEAKKPSVSIKDAPHPAFQLRRYAWSAKLPLSVLTDFEEFAVYDCRVRPIKADRSSAARIKYIKYTEYPDRWDEIASVFSKDAILKGSFDKYAKSTRRKKGTAEVDTAFLNEIETWRDSIARNIAVRNPSLTNRRLNFAVQRTIDRIIFLRIAEDRGIERYSELLATTSGPDTYLRLFKLFEKADDRYNSGLFHFHKEPDRDEPDDLTPTLTIDDKPLKDIIKSLYYPDSPYEFAVLPAEILGQIYEQFLGKVITLTKGHRARIEYKPEVKKAGGVYYTPSYIVDYIVKNTIGKLLEKKTPTAVNNLKILDPACGSGSFLIAAYQYLLDWYLKHYTENNPSKYTKGRNPKLYQTDKGEYRLTIGERKRILLNNIFGVDIDSQAVEVTKLSLLLKVLEGQAQLVLFHKERALPDLGNNIKCGNSLIASDFYKNKQLTMFDEEEMYKINAFDWKKEFPQILNRKNPGFDIVIGNPPYVRPHNLQPHAKEYFWAHYHSFVKKSDLYCCFVEKAISLLNIRGFFGNIISNGWLRLDSFESLRLLLLEQTALIKIVEFTDNVFSKATVKTGILVFRKAQARNSILHVATTNSSDRLMNLELKKLPQSLFFHTYKHIFDLAIDKFQEKVKLKIRRKGVPLGKLFTLSFGLKTGDDSKFLSFASLTSDHRPLLRGKDIHRYSYRFKGEYVHYVPEQMRAHRKTARPGTPERFEQPKILVRDTGGCLQATIDEQSFYVKDVLVISDVSHRVHVLLFILGFLNSKLLRFYYETSFPTLHVQRDELASLPIIDPDLLSEPEDESHHNKMFSLVQTMLDLNKQLAKAKTSHEKTALKRQINTTDRQIDNLVYQLYNLTDKEITIVEEMKSK